MKARWIALAAKLDALSLRERVFVFAGLIGVVTYLLYFGVLNPMYNKQKALRSKISHAQNNIEGFEADMALRAREYAADPDASNRIRLAALKTENEALATQLRNMQKALVAPDRIVPLLESILRSSKRLRLVSLKKLPVIGFNDPLPGSTAHGPVRLDAPNATSSERAVMASTRAEMTAAASAAGVQPPGKPATVADLKLPPAAAAMVGVAAPAAVGNSGTPPPAPAPAGPAVAPPKPPDLLFRHGVEITLSGSYLDMIAYMEALEALPTQLFWGRAEFEVDQYPNARLTLTLYTLSMDKKWMKL